MDCDSIGTTENDAFLTLTLHAFSMGIVMVLCIHSGHLAKME